jgi:hypothetical protein
MAPEELPDAIGRVMRPGVGLRAHADDDVGRAIAGDLTPVADVVALAAAVDAAPLVSRSGTIRSALP